MAVVGTGTGVGKTHASVALIASLVSRGVPVCGLKPIESGVTPGILTDAARLAGVSSVKAGPAPYAFEEAVSPHLAARRFGVAISVEVAAWWVRCHEAPVLVVETAGALVSPLGPGLTNLDLVRALDPDIVLLVGLDRLGVLHEISVCQLAMRTLAPELPAPLVVLNEPAEADASTGTNAAELEHLSIAHEVGVLPRAEPVSERSLEAIGGVLGRMGVRVGEGELLG